MYIMRNLSHRHRQQLCRDARRPDAMPGQARVSSQPVLPASDRHVLAQEQVVPGDVIQDPLARLHQYRFAGRLGLDPELGRLYVISLSYEDALSLSVYIECHLARGRESDAADLKTGDEIKVSGKIKYKRSEIFGRDAIQISGCTIVK